MSKETAKQLSEKLLMKSKNLGLSLSDDDIAKADDFAKGYMSFLNDYKTEREIASHLTKTAQEKGFMAFDRTKTYAAGDKVYYNHRDKAMIFAIIGKKSLAEGTRVIAAHIDSPCVHLKPNPLYEEAEMAFFKTHYYGGIKKYQWTAIPLSLHGVIVKGDGTKITVNIGEDDQDPQFVITDLLPHLAANQMKKSLSEGVEGEQLNILIGSRPFKDDEGSELVKLNILRILNEKYGITEKDFTTAELSLVPAFKVKDVGFDRSMIGGYGQDDRVCAYPATMSIFNTQSPEYTAITVLADKEEVGSDGNTGLNSAYFKYFIEDLARMQNLSAQDVLRESLCLSSDVTLAYDPTWTEPTEKLNTTYLGKGTAVMKYSGSRGKASTSDASAEYMGKVRSILDKNNITWQVGELGKVDAGGGGTVAMYIASLDVDVVDVGVPVLSMHSPFEVTSKLDIYETYKAFYAFFQDKEGKNY